MIAQSSRRSASSLPRRILVVLAVILVGGFARSLPVRGTTDFYGDGFEQQWQADEAVIANFWGPLSTSTARREPYEGSTGGVLCPAHPPTAPGVAFGCAAVGFRDQRNGQYFDKGRMERTIYDQRRDMNGRAIIQNTNGLLAVEMIRGQIQTGDNRFEQRPPATSSIVGDPGNDGPTYADLAGLPERDMTTGIAALPYLFDSKARRWNHAQSVPTGIPQDVLKYTRMTDANGMYDQNVFTPFADFINRLPNGMAAIGLPITPVFFAAVPVNQVNIPLIVQAFERRVLFYNPANPPEQRVDSGMIGSDYYVWRYGPSDPTRYGPSPITIPSTPTPDPHKPAPTATATASP